MIPGCILCSSLSGAKLVTKSLVDSTTPPTPHTRHNLSKDAVQPSRRLERFKSKPMIALIDILLNVKEKKQIAVTHPTLSRFPSRQIYLIRNSGIAATFLFLQHPLFLYFAARIVHHRWFVLQLRHPRKQSANQTK